MKRTTTIYTLCLCLSTFWTTCIFGQTLSSDYALNEVIIRFEPGISPLEQEFILANYNLEIIDGPTPVTRFLLCRINALGFPFLPPGAYQNASDSINGVIETMNDLEADIDGIGLHYDAEPPSVLLDKLHESGGPYYPLDYCLENTFSIDINPLGTTDVSTGVFDTGISGTDTGSGFTLDHESIFGPYFPVNEPGVNLIEPGTYPEDQNGHGTHMSSLIAINIPGSSDPDVFPLRLRSFKTHNAQGTGKIFDIIEAIDQSILYGVKVVNCSFSFLGSVEQAMKIDAPLSIAIKEAGEINGTLFITAAGNSGIDNDQGASGLAAFPASYPNDNILSVASISCQQELSTFSNFGARSVDIAAPGENIIGAHLGTEFSRISGTSPAAALVSRVAAMLASFQTDFDYVPIKCALLAGAKDHPSLTGKVNCGGYLDAVGAYIYFNQNPSCSGYIPEGSGGSGFVRRPNETLAASEDWNVGYLADAFGVRLDIQLAQESVTHIRVYDMMGRSVFQDQLTLPEGINQYQWSHTPTANPQLYLVEVQARGQRQLFKIMR